jgi:hypothetical protein
MMNILQFVCAQVWKALFGKSADSLERSIDHADEYMIVDYEPLTSTFVSVPSDFGQLSVDSYMSGIISGVLTGAGFAARVTAHSVTLEVGEHPPNGSSSSSSTTTTTNVNSILGQQQQGSSGGISNLAYGNHVPPRKEKAVFLVKFESDVLERDATMDR